MKLFNIGLIALTLGLVPFLGHSAQAFEYGLYVKSGEWGWSKSSTCTPVGTVGAARICDAFILSGLTYEVQYRIHVEGDGWKSWTPQGTHTSGFGAKIEAIQFHFPNGIPAGKELRARVHVQNKGWLPVVVINEGTMIGTVGDNLRLEALVMSDQPIVKPQAGSGAPNFKDMPDEDLAKFRSTHPLGTAYRNEANYYHTERLIDNIHVCPNGERCQGAGCCEKGGQKSGGGGGGGGTDGTTGGNGGGSPNPGGYRGGRKAQ